MPVEGAHRQARGWQRVENLLIAIAIVIAVIAWGKQWWLLLVAFLAFDLSALGYLVNQRVGGLFYNLVHNYTAPAALIAGWAVSRLGDIGADWMVLVAACWGFHVAVDRALGYGLKVGSFENTHLGVIKKAAHEGRQSSHNDQ